MALANWQSVGAGSIARLANIKQYYEIQVYQASPPVFIYMRRRITLVTLQFEVEYMNCLPTVGSSGANDWLSAIDVPNLKDYVATIDWYESGYAGLQSIGTYDDNGLNQATSGMWLIDVKDISATGDGACTVLVTFRNEGAWHIDV